MTINENAKILRQRLKSIAKDTATYNRNGQKVYATTDALTVYEFIIQVLQMVDLDDIIQIGTGEGISMVRSGAELTISSIDLDDDDDLDDDLDDDDEDEDDECVFCPHKNYCPSSEYYDGSVYPPVKKMVGRIHPVGVAFTVGDLLNTIRSMNTKNKDEDTPEAEDEDTPEAEDECCCGCSNCNCAAEDEDDGQDAVPEDRQPEYEETPTDTAVAADIEVEE